MHPPVYIYSVVFQTIYNCKTLLIVGAQLYAMCARFKRPYNIYVIKLNILATGNPAWGTAWYLAWTWWPAKHLQEEHCTRKVGFDCSCSLFLPGSADPWNCRSACGQGRRRGWKVGRVQLVVNQYFVHTCQVLRSEIREKRDMEFSGPISRGGG